MKDLHLSFDIGHSSIGWAVIRQDSRKRLPAVLGTGTVTFPADDCLAVKRRQHRQTRRHNRSTKQRISNMGRLLVHCGVLSQEEISGTFIAGAGDSFAWKKAAIVLQAARNGGDMPAVSSKELWGILRWYAHNRGYFSPPWASATERKDFEDDESDIEKVQNAYEALRSFQTKTMAETVDAFLTSYEQAVAEWHQKCRPEKPKHFKGLNAAFPREIVWGEVRALLGALKVHFPKLDGQVIRCLLGNEVDPLADPKAWDLIPCGIKLPKRFYGGILFGQLVPRFDNRIIGVCPFLFARKYAELIAEGNSPDQAKKDAEKKAKLPLKRTPEFLRFRWAMLLVNISGAQDRSVESAPLNEEQRRQLDDEARVAGGFTKADLIKRVLEITGWRRSNLPEMLMHPDLFHWKRSGLCQTASSNEFSGDCAGGKPSG
jgi:CRISPR-associated endonuclease Csn1